MSSDLGIRKVPTKIAKPLVLFSQYLCYWLAVYNMCVGWLEKHHECGHIKEYHVISRCPTADGDVECWTACWTVNIYKPSLCVQCYRRKERQICQVFDDQIQMMERRIESLKQTLIGLESQTYRDATNSLLSDCEDELFGMMADRHQELSEFRDQQGVWGDG